ncbi:zinc ribbon-containing protein [Paraferrimonas sp. SM1919]|uniref:zinc ribbon-containing protein n=1 Tax=Paraferrimonas sp. SM1919 TaxID=2662263 RepID=UPI0013D5AB76|nr:zinc ribbon-containing protein [Paraferrimonas sp. SM1919]
MSENSRLLTAYHELLTQLQKRYTAEPDLTMTDLPALLEKSLTYLDIQGFADEDDLLLTERYIRRDIRSFLHNRDANILNKSVSILLARDSLWQWLYSMADHQRVEMHELNHDLSTNGVYLSGEIIGHGDLECYSCHHQSHYDHPQKIGPCVVCDSLRFSRPTMSKSLYH